MPLTITKSDAQIKADVLQELKCDRSVDDADLRVDVKDGIVTLTGRTSAHAKRLAAREAAHRVWGVHDVIDEITVQIPRVWERTDEELARAARNALIWDVLAPDDRIGTTVSQGLVTLQGSVDTWIQRRDAELCVQRLTGLKGVINQITVAAPAVDAATIKRAIEQAIERQTEREAKRIGVAVRDGVVTLTGALRSWGEKNAIERAAANAPGVRRVEDRTAVDPYQ